MRRWRSRLPSRIAPPNRGEVGGGLGGGVGGGWVGVIVNADRAAMGARSKQRRVAKRNGEAAKCRSARVALKAVQYQVTAADVVRGEDVCSGAVVPGGKGRGGSEGGGVAWAAAIKALGAFVGCAPGGAQGRRPLRRFPSEGVVGKAGKSTWTQYALVSE